MSWETLSDQERQWIEGYCNQTINADAFAEFETELEKSSELRSALRQYLALDSNLGRGVESMEGVDEAWTPSDSEKVVRFPGWSVIAAAAAIAFFIGIVSNRLVQSDPVGQSIEEVEVTANGYAVVHGSVDAVVEGRTNLSSGDVLGAETITLSSGSARIDFFSGAQIYIEGPAELEIRSAWEAAFHAGKLSAKVPPAARGFTIESNGRRIVDLGTEFGIDTNAEEVKVEVFSGKVELEDRELIEGQAVSMTRDGTTKPIESSAGSFSKLFSMASSWSDTTLEAFEGWQRHSDELSHDSRLIAYYPFSQKPVGRSDWVPSELYPENRELDGAAILAEWVDGRWGELKGAMEFRRPGARVRVNIPGEFSAFTFSCWARIDSLDRKYSALFLADSYQNGEPHWQIRNDGELMFGVMIDETRPQPALVTDSSELTGPNAARNYHTPPIWDMSMSGEWLHIVSVYDPANRAVTQYVNGAVVSEHEIIDDFYTETLRIGNAEIGNWGQPFRKDPEFAIRNLNGRIGELAIFDAALSSEEIKALFERCKRN